MKYRFLEFKDVGMEASPEIEAKTLIPFGYETTEDLCGIAVQAARVRAFGEHEGRVSLLLFMTTEDCEAGKRCVRFDWNDGEWILHGAADLEARSETKTTNELLDHIAALELALISVGGCDA